MIIAVDFDGTCVTHEFPYLGKDTLEIKRDEYSYIWNQYINCY